MARGRIREVALNLLVLGFTLALFGAFFEIAIRLLAPQTVLTLKDLYVPDAEVGFRHRAGFVGHERNAEYDVRIFIDGHGYRVPATPDDEATDALRIVGLGDSFTFGSGVEAEEVYLERIEDLLGERSERPVTVINAGAGGMGLDNETRLLQADVDVLRPDIVIVGFYVGNDVRDVMVGYDRFVVDPDGLRQWKPGVLDRYRHPLRPGEIVRDDSIPERAGIQRESPQAPYVHLRHDDLPAVIGQESAAGYGNRRAFGRAHGKDAHEVAVEA